MLSERGYDDFFEQNGDRQHIGQHQQKLVGKFLPVCLSQIKQRMIL